MDINLLFLRKLRQTFLKNSYPEWFFDQTFNRFLRLNNSNSPNQLNHRNMLSVPLVGK